MWYSLQLSFFLIIYPLFINNQPRVDQKKWYIQVEIEPIEPKLMEPEPTMIATQGVLKPLIPKILIPKFEIDKESIARNVWRWRGDGTIFCDCSKRCTACIWDYHPRVES